MSRKLAISKLQKISWKLFSGIIFYITILLLLLLLVFQFEGAQTFLAQKSLEVISEKTDHELSLQKVKIAWLDRGELVDFLIRDRAGDTLVYADRVTINYRLLDILSGDYFVIEEILMPEAKVKVTRHHAGEALNVKYLIESLKNKKEGGGSNAYRPIRIDHLESSHINLRIDDKEKANLKGQTDFANLDFSIHQLNLFNIELRTDTVVGDLKHFRGTDKISGLSIEKFETVFRVTDHSLNFNQLELQTKTSRISDSLAFFYNGFDDFEHFLDSVSFVSHLDHTIISHHDIALISGFDRLYAPLKLDGLFWGMARDFNIAEATVGYGESTFLSGEVSCTGLPDLKNTFILADISSATLNPPDLVPYIGALSKNFERMGKIGFRGSFIGFIDDFVAKGNFKTDEGTISTDLKVEIPKGLSSISYDGSVAFEQVNVGAFFENDIIQQVNLKTNITGQGIHPKDARFVLDAKIFDSVVKGYRYDSIGIKGSFAQNSFSGAMAVEDPSCTLKQDISVDFRKSKEALTVSTVIDHIDFRKLNLLSDSLALRGNIQLQISDFKGLQGKLEVEDALLKYAGKQVVLDSLHFESSQVRDSVRNITFAMPGVSAGMKGVFEISDLLKDIPVMIEGYLKKLQLGGDSLRSESSHAEYGLSAYVSIKDISPYLDSLRIPLKIYNEAAIEVSYRQGKSSHFSMLFEADSMAYDQASFTFPGLEVNAALDTATLDVLTNFILKSETQRIGSIPETKALEVEGIWYQNSIDITTLLHQPSSKTDLILYTEVGLAKDVIYLHMNPSKIRILDDKWHFHPENRILFKKGKVEIANMEIYDSSESISLEGSLSKEEGTSISVSVEELKMNKANLFSTADLGGYLNGECQIFRTKDQDRFSFDGAFFLKNLVYNEVLIGDLNGSVSWNPSEKFIYSQMYISRENFKSIDVKGYYHPLREQDQLSFVSRFNDAELIMAKPFLESQFSDFQGTADGEITIKGQLNDPQLEGIVTFNGAGARVDYLNTAYKLGGQVRLSNNKIDLDQLIITDRKGSIARAFGAIQYKGFSDLRYDIGLEATNFELLHTTFIENERYYGSAYGTGQIGIQGVQNDMQIQATLKTDPGTRFFIPVTENTEGTQEAFIQFVDFTDSTLYETVEEKLKLEGVSLDFDLDITPDAYCELIFDIKKRDIIRGRGRGNIKLALDKEGEFSMFGGLEITEGTYNFTFTNWINKEFVVTPGGEIKWYGDPYEGSLALTASYVQRASLDELKNPDDIIGSPSPKIPFNAIIMLEGNMNAPTVRFDIQPQNEGDVQNNSEGIGLLSQVKQDEQELSKQFVSLLFLKKFSPIASFFGAGVTNLTGGVSEILSNQFSYLFSQIDENLEVELDLADLDQEAFNTFQLRLAYTFFDGRLKVTSGGNFGNSNGDQENSINEIVGDWSVEYALTKDGRLRIKAFRNANNLITSGEQNFEKGFSLKFIDSFDKIQDILRLGRERALKRKYGGSGPSEAF